MRNRYDLDLFRTLRFSCITIIMSLSNRLGLMILCNVLRHCEAQSVCYLGLFLWHKENRDFIATHVSKLDQVR